MRTRGSHSALLTRAVALLLVICLAECAAEQRINTRDSKTPSLIEKGNGWRGQRGGSCLSYGHSCWGAHGKRSGKARMSEEDARSTAHLSDWYLAKLLRRMSGDVNLYPTRNILPVENISNNDLNAIFRTRLADNGHDIAKLVENEDAPSEDMLVVRRDLESLRLDEEPQVKAKLLQIMKDSSDEK